MSALVGAEQRELMLGNVSIIVAGRDVELRPHLMRAVGCRLEADSPLVSILLARSTCRQLLADLASNGQIAVVFSQPSTHRSLQLKGIDARVGPAEAGDAECAADYVRRLVFDIASIGFDERLVRAMLSHSPDDLVAVAFTPVAAYDQTPGPRAGQSLATP